MTRSKSLIVGVAAIATALALAACSRGPDRRQAGQWESTAKVTAVELTGAPPQVQAQANAQVGQTRTARECVTEAQARDPLAQMQQMLRDGPVRNCQFTDQVFAGGTIRIRGTCAGAGGGSAQVSLEGSFTETTMQTTMTVNATGPASASMPGVTGMRMSMQVDSRRVGDCPGGSGTGNTL